MNPSSDMALRQWASNPDDQDCLKMAQTHWARA